MTLDVQVVNHGSIVTLDLLTDAARDWVKDNVPDDATFWAGSLVAEPRYVANLVMGMTDDGLVVA